MKKTFAKAVAAMLLLPLMAVGCRAQQPAPTQAAPTPLPEKVEWAVGVISSYADFESARFALYDNGGALSYRVPVAAAGIQAGRYQPPTYFGRNAVLFSRREARLLLFDMYAMSDSWMELDAVPSLVCGEGDTLVAAFESPLSLKVLPDGAEVSLEAAVTALCITEEGVWAALYAAGTSRLALFGLNNLEFIKEVSLPKGDVPWALCQFGGSIWAALQPIGEETDGRLLRISEAGDVAALSLGAGQPPLQLLPIRETLVVNRYSPAAQSGRVVTLISADGTYKKVTLKHNAVQMTAFEGVLYVTDRADVYAYSLPDLTPIASFTALEDPSLFSGLISP